MTKLQKSLKKIFKISVLMGIKESYLLASNLYGIVEHPKLTMSRIVKKRDLSQGILIFGLPVGLWLAWLFILLFSRFFIFGRLKFGILAKASFLVSTLITFFLLLLFAYFFFKVWEKERRKSESR